MPLQSLIQTIYPPQCVMCDARTEVDFALCGACWSDTPFIDGLCCDGCGTPLPGEGETNDGLLCDDCMVIDRPWRKGRAALLYKDKARRFILSLKHGDRVELARAAGPWLSRAGADLLKKDVLVVPIPLHRFRLLKRRYNQAALLAQAVARVAEVEWLPDALTRNERTRPLDGHTRDQRFAAMEGVIVPTPKRIPQLTGRDIVLIDDVMTSGATFAAATEACFAAGANDVCVLSLARVAKDA